MRPHPEALQFQEISAVPTADQALENEFVAGRANYLVTRYGFRFLNALWLRRSGFKSMAASWTRFDGPKHECLARGARNNLVWHPESFPALQPVDQPLNPSLPLGLSSFLGRVVSPRVIKIVHAPRPIDHASSHRRGTPNCTVDAAKVVNGNVERGRRHNS
jgi:hypothetical protein